MFCKCGISVFSEPLPTVPKLFTQSVTCPRCQYANDSTFRFCQSCGYKRRLLISDQARTTDAILDVPALDNRLLQIASVSASTSYAKQKSSLQKELESFLASFAFPKDISTATPRDLCRFWYGRIEKGKRKYMTPTANSSHTRFCFLAHVQRVLPMAPWTP